MRMEYLKQEQRMILVHHMIHFQRGQDLLRLNYFHELQSIGEYVPIKSSVTAYFRNSVSHTIAKP